MYLEASQKGFTMQGQQTGDMVDYSNVAAIGSKAM